jgi:SAM-dependent methyltransferase
VRLGVRAWALGAAQGEPRAALRRILELHHDLYLRADHLAIAYDGGVHAKHRLTRYHDFFVERIREGERVLDVGCGKGELARDLAERAGAEVVGIDPDRAYLAFARERSAHPRVRYVEGRAPEQLPDERFDVVVLSNVLEHVERRIELLRTLVSRQRPSRVLVRVPAEDRDWLVPLRRELGLPHLSDPDHEIEYTRETLERELAEAGLTVADARAAWGELWVEARPR